MGILNSNKTISAEKIGCGESVDITLSLTASPDLNEVPKEIVLVLDASRSMKGEPFDALEKAALKFLDIFDVESDGIKNNLIGGQSRTALVTFASTARIASELTASTLSISSKIKSIIPDGSTNHKDAFQKAIEVLSRTTGKEKIIILFTDGVSNSGFEGFEVAQQAKDMGITIYCIAYGSGNNLDAAAVRQWASSPSSAYSFITPNLEDIEPAFTALIRNIAKPGATQISVTDTISSCFEITSVPAATRGTVSLLSPNTIQWDMDALGTAAHESASCTFTARPRSGCSGDIIINTSTDYKDAENNIVTFSSPVLKVECSTPAVIAEPCTAAADIKADSCTDFAEYDANDVTIGAQGRILRFNLTIKNVCPNRPVALAVMLNEKDDLGAERSRGMKTFLIPPQPGTSCQDISVRCINFILPEDSLCAEKNFSVRAIAHYADSSFACCE